MCRQLTEADRKHGIKRTKVSKEAEEAKRVKELSKIQAYTALQEDVLSLVGHCLVVHLLISETTEGVHAGSAAEDHRPARPQP